MVLMKMVEGSSAAPREPEPPPERPLRSPRSPPPLPPPLAAWRAADLEDAPEEGLARLDGATAAAAATAAASSPAPDAAALEPPPPLLLLRPLDGRSREATPPPLGPAARGGEVEGSDIVSSRRAPPSLLALVGGDRLGIRGDSSPALPFSSAVAAAATAARRLLLLPPPPPPPAAISPVALGSTPTAAPAASTRARASRISGGANTRRRSHVETSERTRGTAAATAEAACAAAASLSRGSTLSSMRRTKVPPASTNAILGASSSFSIALRHKISCTR